MSKLALDHEILMTIEKPARYIGGEVNAVYKNKEDVRKLAEKYGFEETDNRGYDDYVRYIRKVK